MMDADRYFALGQLRADCRTFRPRSKSELLALALDHALPPNVAAELANGYDPKVGAESLPPRVEWRDEPAGDELPELQRILKMFHLDDD